MKRLLAIAVLLILMGMDSPLFSSTYTHNPLRLEKTKVSMIEETTNKAEITINVEAVS